MNFEEQEASRNYNFEGNNGKRNISDSEQENKALVSHFLKIHLRGFISLKVRKVIVRIVRYY